MEAFGWDWAFYVCALITLLTAIAWFILVADTPAEHPRITVAERTYIEESLGNSVSAKKAIPPYLKFLTSLPFLSLMLLHYGNLWGLFFLMTAAPKFLSEVLHFNLAKTGILASLPSLARLLAGFLFGAIGDRLRRNGSMDLTLMRKVFCIFCASLLDNGFWHVPEFRMLTASTLFYSAHHPWPPAHFDLIHWQLSRRLCCDYYVIFRFKRCIDNNQFTKFTRLGTKFCRHIVFDHQFCGHH